MNPAFAASRRRLIDLAQELERLKVGKRLLDLIRAAPNFEAANKAWVVNTTLSAGVSGLYTGMEDVLRGLLALVDEYVPGGERSHQDILDQASVNVDGLRPAIIGQEVYDALVDLKGFRHFERHNYGFRFDGFLVEENEVRAEGLVAAFIVDVEAFIAVMSQSPEHLA